MGEKLKGWQTEAKYKTFLKNYGPHYLPENTDVGKVSSIYKLNPVTDNPIFEGFGSGDTPSVLGRSSIRDDFFPADRNDWNWTLSALSPVWRPLKVSGRVGSFNDFPCIAMMIPAFSKRAIDVLSDMLEPNGELLPVSSGISTTMPTIAPKLLRCWSVKNAKPSG